MKKNQLIKEKSDLLIIMEKFKKLFSVFYYSQLYNLEFSFVVDDLSTSSIIKRLLHPCSLFGIPF